MAEWSKAPALGAGPKGRGFEPHCCHVFRAAGTLCAKERFRQEQQGTVDTDRVRMCIRATRPRGPMDKASVFGTEDCRFESYRGHRFWLVCWGTRFCFRVERDVAHGCLV